MLNFKAKIKMFSFYYKVYTFQKWNVYYGILFEDKKLIILNLHFKDTSYQFYTQNIIDNTTVKGSFFKNIMVILSTKRMNL